MDQNQDIFERVLEDQSFGARERSKKVGQFLQYIKIMNYINMLK
jgi:hypothetical protein